MTSSLCPWVNTGRPTSQYIALALALFKAEVCIIFQSQRPRELQVKVTIIIIPLRVYLHSLKEGIVNNMKAPVYDRLARVAGAKRGRLVIDVALKHENQVLDTGFKNDLFEGITLSENIPFFEVSDNRN